MRLAIISVHVSAEWAAIQAKFLKLTTADYVYGIVGPQSILQEIQGQIGSDAASWIVTPGNKCSHSQGILHGCRWLRTQPVDWYLLLDSDAWPVKSDWQDVLTSAMRRRTYAAPVRCENGDLFPHPSFLFAKRVETIAAAVRLQNPIRTLFGTLHRDVGSGIPAGRWFFPLLRSNRWSPSPLLHSIYYDIAYHRGIGSNWTRRQIEGMVAGHYWRGMHLPDCMTMTVDEALMNRLVGEERFCVST